MFLSPRIRIQEYALKSTDLENKSGSRALNEKQEKKTRPYLHNMWYESRDALQRDGLTKDRFFFLEENVSCLNYTQVRNV